MTGHILAGIIQVGIPVIMVIVWRIDSRLHAGENYWSWPEENPAVDEEPK